MDAGALELLPPVAVAQLLARDQRAIEAVSDGEQLALRIEVQAHVHAPLLQAFNERRQIRSAERGLSDRPANVQQFLGLDHPRRWQLLTAVPQHTVVGVALVADAGLQQLMPGAPVAGVSPANPNTFDFVNDRPHGSLGVEKEAHVNTSAAEPLYELRDSRTPAASRGDRLTQPLQLVSREGTSHRLRGAEALEGGRIPFARLVDTQGLELRPAAAIDFPVGNPCVVDLIPTRDDSTGLVDDKCHADFVPPETFHEGCQIRAPGRGSEHRLLYMLELASGEPRPCRQLLSQPADHFRIGRPAEANVECLPLVRFAELAGAEAMSLERIADGCDVAGLVRQETDVDAGGLELLDESRHTRTAFRGGPDGSTQALENVLVGLPLAWGHVAELLDDGVV